MKCLLSLPLVVAVFLPWPPFNLQAEVVSTAVGNGADIELRERDDPTASRINAPDLNTRWNTVDRNEVVGLRFDLSGYTLSQLTDVSLNLINYRTNNTRYVDIYGVLQGSVGGTGTYSTETWSDTGPSAVQQWGDLPGLLISDGSDTTLSIDTSSLMLLVDNFVFTQLDEGTVESATSPGLTEFVQNYTGSSKITFLLTQASPVSNGQCRFASKEAGSLANQGGSPGDFAPYLEFAVTTPPPPLVITNTAVTPDGLVLSGTGGSSNGPFATLASTNLAIPTTDWAAISTNTFDGLGNFVVTNPYSVDRVAEYFQLLTLSNVPPPTETPIGFASLNGGTTGGAGGTTQVVSTAGAFITAVGSAGARVVLVDGLIDIDGSGTGSVNVQSDKTIVGVDSNSWVVGQLQISAAHNVIIRNLSISNNGAPSTLDGVRIVNGSHNVWVDHCTFVDCSDGSIDVTVASDYVTISWNKFMYVNQTEHRFVNLIAASETDVGDYRITFHHNWWSTGCDQRMPMSRYGTVHLFNNYYFAPGNNYCSNARTNAQFLFENNYFQQVDDPIFTTSNGRVRTTGNIYSGTTGALDPGTDTLDPILTPPPYPYTLEAATGVPSIVTAGAGASRGPFQP